MIHWFHWLMPLFQLSFSLKDVTANPIIIYNSSTALFSLALQINNGNGHNAELQSLYDLTIPFMIPINII